MAWAIAGRDTTILFEHLDASNWLNSYEIERESDDLEITRFGPRDKEYLAGPRENTVGFEGHWTGEDGSFDELIDDTYGATGERTVSVFPAGCFAGKTGYLTPAVQTSDSLSAEADELAETELEFRSSSVRRAKALWGIDVAATETGESDALIVPAATAFGASVHLHVLEVVGGITGVEFEVEMSADGTTWSSLFDLGTFTKKGAKRMFTLPTAAVHQQVRVKHTITGGTNPAVVYGCAFARHTYR